MTATTASDSRPLWRRPAVIVAAGFLFEQTGSYDAIWWLAVALGVFAAPIHWPIQESRAPAAGALRHVLSSCPIVCTLSPPANTWTALARGPTVSAFSHSD